MSDPHIWDHMPAARTHLNCPWFPFQSSRRPQRKSLYERLEKDRTGSHWRAVGPGGLPGSLGGLGLEWAELGLQRDC